MYKHLYLILLGLLFFTTNIIAQHNAHFETKELTWNAIIFTIAEESQILKNTSDVLELKVQEQQMMVHKYKVKKTKFSKAIPPFSKKYQTNNSEVYTKETKDFNAAYLFREYENKFTVSILLQKKTQEKELYYLDMYTNTLIGQLTTEHLSALKYMVEMLIDNLKL